MIVSQVPKMSTQRFLVIVILQSFILFISPVCGNQIDKLRELMGREAEKNPSLYDPIDLARVMNISEEWHAQRYLSANNFDLNKAFTHIKRILAWRKSVAMNQLTVKDFPCEFLYSGFIQVVPDRKSRPTLVFDLAMNRRFPEIAGYLAFYSHWVTDLYDLQSREGGLGCIVPLGHLGVNNFDVQASQSYFPLVERYPRGYQYFLMHEPGLVLGSAVRLMMSMMPDEVARAVKVTDGAEAYKYIKKKDLPKGLAGGKAKHIIPPPLIPNPKECASIWQVARKQKWARDNVLTYLEAVTPYVKKNRKDNS